LAEDGSGLDVRARMFAPALGIAEDPATGGAAVTLAAYLGERQPVADGTTAWVIGQGAEIGHPSVLRAEAVKTAGRVVLRVGGQVAAVDTGTFGA
jgi:trans-2,3-dihydro-3-hydroxyanthranilate isomerase